MKAFRQGEPVILKEGSSSSGQLAKLEALHGKLPRSAERQLEASIRTLRAGIVGEKQILHELRNSHMDMIVPQDVYLEHDGLSAQIDCLVLTRQRHFVIECKNLYGNVTVNEHGDLIRQPGGGRREGFYSPVSQNKRHLALIRAMRLDGHGMLRRLIIDRSFDDQCRSLVVLANPKTIIDTRQAPSEIRDAIVRADQLVERIKAVNDERGIGRERVWVILPKQLMRSSTKKFKCADVTHGGAPFHAVGAARMAGGYRRRDDERPYVRHELPPPRTTVGTGPTSRHTLPTPASCSASSTSMPRRTSTPRSRTSSRVTFAVLWQRTR